MGKVARIRFVVPLLALGIAAPIALASYGIVTAGRSGGPPFTKSTPAVTLAVGSPPGRVGAVRVIPFRVAGSVGSLQPGVTQALNPSITNPNSVPLSVTSLVVRVTALKALRAAAAPAAALPCTLADFGVQQYSGGYPLRVPRSSTRTLSSLRVAATRWPQLAILNRPRIQDGCQRASLTLAFSGSGRLG